MLPTVTLAGRRISELRGTRWITWSRRFYTTLGLTYAMHIWRCLIDLSRFKSASSMVTAFEARRLPRAFLVLLESLLNPLPSARPSCERVSSAIREGRVGGFHTQSFAPNVLIFDAARPSE